MSHLPNLGEICWYELATPNVQAAKDFYGQMFGWKFSDHEIGEMTYTMIKVNDKDFGGIWAIPKDKIEDIRPHWMAYILVDAIEQAYKKAQKFGAILIHEATPVGDMGRFAIIQDPTGAHIALWQTLKQK
ncbi:MAG: VOC family protein [Parachlamydiaceae bacterium]|nr:MAG: VOC family protein [Parachlamydiaceae bacterium]